MKHASAAIVLTLAAAVGCRCGHGSSPESGPPSNQADSALAFGLAWLPADTTVVARFAPEYGIIDKYLAAHPESPPCISALLRGVSSSYMVHRFIADPPVNVVLGDLPRADAEACIAEALGADVHHETDERLTRVSLRGQTTWLAWADEMVVWHDDLDRVLAVLATTDRLTPDAAMARLLPRLPRTGAGVVTTADFTSPIFRVRSTGLVDTALRGAPAGHSGRLLFESETDATAMMHAFAKRTSRDIEGPGGLGDDVLSLLEPAASGNEVILHVGIAWDHPDALIGLAEFMGVPTKPD